MSRKNCSGVWLQGDVMTSRGTKTQLFVAQESKMRENHISAASLSVGWLKATPRRLSRISQSRET